jgi:hypothetical protein
MRRIIIILLVVVIVYFLINKLVPWNCETFSESIPAETNVGSYTYSEFSIQRGPSGKRSFYGGYPAVIHEKCTRFKSVIYVLTVGEGFGSFETWMEESDLTLLNPVE